MSNINLLSIYIPNKELALVQNISNNTDFELGFLDNTTYKEECNVYYNLYINDNLVSDKQYDKYHAYSKGQIIELLMNQYGVNTIVNPDSQAIKIWITKNINSLGKRLKSGFVMNHQILFGKT